MKVRPNPRDLMQKNGNGPRIYSKDFKEKVCNCELHQGTLVPISEFWTFKNGPHAGRLMSMCARGTRVAHGRHPDASGYMKYSRVRFIFKELEFRIGRYETTRRMGISNAFWSRHENSVQLRAKSMVRKETVIKAMELLRDVRAAGEARHRDSIRHGAAKRGRLEKKPAANTDFNGTDDSDAQRNRVKRRRLREAS